MADKSPRVKTATEGILALGGANFVAKLLRKRPNVVRNWYKRGFPPEAHHTLAPLLRQAGYVFSDEDLFRQYRARPPKKQRQT
jgi:hypothetical protein